MDPYNDDERDRRNIAAIVIQRGWRDFQTKKQSEVDRMAAATDGTAAPKELSEEERRDQLLAHCQTLLTEREGIIQHNLALQKQLVRVMAEKKAANDAAAVDLVAGVVQDAEHKYWETIKGLRQDRTKLDSNREVADIEMRESRVKNETVLSEALQCEQHFRDFIAETARNAIFLRNSKSIPPRTVDIWAMEDALLQTRIHEARVQFLRLRNKSTKLSSELKNKEQLNDGLHLIDFEQLKIENTSLNEKIEERNEDLLKLRKKATTTIHILTHVKEKVEFVKLENIQLHKQVQQQDELLTVLRDRLAQTKRDRDAYVNENQRMKEKMPMIGAEDLLTDFELRKHELKRLRMEIVSLTNQHHELLQWISGHQGRLEKLQTTATAAGLTV